MTRGAWWRLSATLGCACIALSPLYLGVSSSSAQPPTGTAGPLLVSLSSMRPVAPQPGDTLVLRGTVTNISDTNVTGLTSQLRMGGPVSARSTFDAYADDPDGSVAELPVALADPTALSATTLGPGRSESFQIEASLDPTSTGLPTSSWQVRELDVTITGLTSLGTQVASLRTFLPWAPAGTVGPQPLGVAWLWPLVDRPHRVSGATWLDDSLAGELAPGGRLANLIGAAVTAAHQAPPPPTPPAHGKQPKHRRGAHDAGATPQPPAQPPATDVPVTWAIDPMLVDDVTAMRGSYQVRDGSKLVAGTGSGAAKAWLAALRTATAGGSVIPLPYGDPDVVAAVRNGLSTLVGVAATTGRKVLQQQLPDATELDTGWPPGGVIDQRAVDALFSDGDSSLVLSDVSLPPVVVPNETPSARASLVTAAGDIPTVLSDSILSDAVSDGAANGADSALALQRFLAETLMIEAEAPSDQRSILIAPAARWQPSAAYATSLLADSGKVPWISPTTVDNILDSAPSQVERQPLDYPAAAKQQELAPTYLHEIGRLQRSLSQLTDVLPPGDAETRPASTGLLRALSTAWRATGAQRHRWITRYAAALHAMTAGVHIVSVPNSTVTLTGHGGKVPVTIANTLAAPAQVTVQLDANQRLALPQNGRVAVTIPAGQQTTVDVHATAKTSGVFALEVQLLTPNGQKYGTPVQLFVRSTVYGTITIVITGVATAALLVAVAIRLTRRAIAARRAANAAGT